MSQPKLFTPFRIRNLELDNRSPYVPVLGNGWLHE